jgi:hypothetical protein
MTDNLPSPPRPIWSPELRTWVSLLLFAHLFALFVTVTTYTRPSGLQIRIFNLFEPYLRNLHLTAYPVTYPFARYHLTHATDADVDFTFEVEVQGAGKDVDKVVIPEPGLRPGVRFRRYQALANAIGTLVQPDSDEDLAGVLPRAIAGSILRRHGATQGIVRCRSHGTLAIDEEPSAARRAAAESEIYRAQAFVSPSGVELLKISEKLESAPVEPATKTPGTPGGPSTRPK